MKAVVAYQSGVSFKGISGTGHSIIMDGPEGDNQGPRPMELLLLGMGGCTAYDVVSILKKSRESIEDCEVEIESERATEPPKVFTKIHLHYKLKGENLTPAKVERAINLSTEKYCSATIILAKTATVTHSYELLQN